MPHASLRCWLCGHSGETKPRYAWERLLFPVAPYSKWPRVETEKGKRYKRIRETSKRYVCIECLVTMFTLTKRLTVPGRDIVRQVQETFLKKMAGEPHWVRKAKRYKVNLNVKKERGRNAQQGMGKKGSGT